MGMFFKEYFPRKGAELILIRESEEKMQPIKSLQFKVIIFKGKLPEGSLPISSAHSVIIK